PATMSWPRAAWIRWLMMRGWTAGRNSLAHASRLWSSTGKGWVRSTPDWARSARRNRVCCRIFAQSRCAFQLLSNQRQRTRCLGHASVMLGLRQAEHLVVGAQVAQQVLLSGDDRRLLRLADHLDDVALCVVALAGD